MLASAAKIRFVLGGVILVVALVFSVEPVDAATFVVNSTADAPDASPGDGVCATAAGACTLRAAIQEANALGGAHTINLSVAGTYALTVAGPLENAAAGGDLDVNGVTLTIANTSRGRVAIDGGGADRVFDIGPTAPAEVTISGVTIQNGLAATTPPSPATSVGGGILISGSSSLTLTDVTVSGNRAIIAGGGIAFSLVDPTRRGTLTLSSVTIRDNTAGSLGGGLLNSQVASLTDVTIRDNRLTGTTAPMAGGGITNTGTLTVADSTISGNFAGGVGAGGGINNTAGATMRLTDVIVRDNQGAIGAGLTSLGTSTLTRVTVRDNRAFLAGGGFTSAGVATLNEVIIRDNSSADIDGGLGNGGRMTLTNVIIRDNAAATVNGGFANPGNATLTNVTISGNTAASLAGISNLGTLEATNVTISGNAARGPRGVGGGLANANLATLTNVTINGNSATRSGGGIGNDADILAAAREREATIQILFGGTFVFPAGPGRVTLRSTIVANSSSGGNCSGPIESAGDNLSSDGTCDLRGRNDRNSTDPRLGPLRDNGGFTETHALRGGSPAIDAVLGDCPPPRTDQRGVDRPQGPRCDIGAFEFGVEFGVELGVDTPNNDDEEDDKRRLTEEQKQQRERTNTLGLDDHRTEGNVLATRCDEDPPVAVIANRDGDVTVRLLGETGTQCRRLSVGDYLEVDGEKQHELLYDGYDVTFRRGGARVR